MPPPDPYTDLSSDNRLMANLETELLTAWDETIADLTPDQRKILATATAQDWTKAISDCVTDSSFWAEIGAAFVEGMIKGATR